MSVYVDDARIPYGRMKMCHMIADSRPELLEMADKIGIDRRWLQCESTSREHFDVCLEQRKLAVRAGAIEVSTRELACIRLAIANRPFPLPEEQEGE